MKTQLLTTVMIALTAAHAAAAPPLIEVTVDAEKYRGRLAAHDDDFFWLIGRDGRLDVLRINAVSGFQQIPGRFSPFSAADLRGRLNREFGTGYEIASTSHYLVCGSRGTARQHAQSFEDLYRSFQIYFSVRGFTVREPEFPLVAVVFPNRAEFLAYCRAQGVGASTELVGIYLHRSNRVALYETGHGVPSRDDFETVIHEATHQVAFNAGLHRRTADNPQWVVEGLATAFESPGIRDTTPNRPRTARVNHGRLAWFRDYVRARRKPSSLRSFLADDEPFKSSVLDAYSEAWALTFYLIETRPRQYAQYLKSINRRPPLAAYEPDQRIADFEAAFGNDIERLEVELLRFVSRL